MTHILLVDDEELVRVVLENFLTNAGYQVTTATNPIDAYQIFQQNKIDLVITDVEMKVSETGIDLCSKVKSISQTTPVLVMSGNPSAHQQNAIHKGADVFISKPIQRMQDFLNVISSLV